MNCSIERVISGGQTGADQAGWRAAKSAGIPTGGWMPKGFLTEDGPRPEFAELYGAREHPSKEYPPRTRDNVILGCVLIWFGDPKSPGGRLTFRVAQEKGIAFRYKVEDPASEWAPDPVARHVLNAFDQIKRHFPRMPASDRSIVIAGNRESSNPGIGTWVEAHLAEMFQIMKETPG